MPFNLSLYNLPKNKRHKGNVLEYKKEAVRYHPTQKPVALLEDLIKTFSNKGDTVLDLTMGSASTAIACINTNRKFIGFELDEGYCNIAKERVQKHLNTQNANNNQVKSKKE